MSSVQLSSVQLDGAARKAYRCAMSPDHSDRDPAWTWDEPRWRAAVQRVRAGRSLSPKSWKDGARVCVALSFDSDHETSTLREGSVSPGRLAQGEYGSRAAVREVGLLYDASRMADDEPYELLEDGEPTGIVELPVEWIKDDAPYFGMNRASGLRPYTPPSSVLEIFKAEFDGAVAEGGLFLLTMHPHITGHRSRMAGLVQLIEYMKSVDRVWFATHEDVARYCLANA